VHRIGISLNSLTMNEASVATFARSGASYVRFIAKGISPHVYVSLAISMLKSGRAINPDFTLVVDLPGRRPRMGGFRRAHRVPRHDRPAHRCGHAGRAVSQQPVDPNRPPAGNQGTYTAGRPTARE
jgi:hypothetical protein